VFRFDKKIVCYVHYFLKRPSHEMDQALVDMTKRSRYSKRLGVVSKLVRYSPDFMFKKITGAFFLLFEIYANVSR